MCFATVQSEMQIMQNGLHEVLTERQTERRGGPQRWFYLLVLLLKDV